MKIKRFLGGYDNNFCYVLSCNETSTATIIDPSVEINPVTDHIDSNDLILDKILITHTHYDHIHYLDDFINLYSESEREELFLSLIQKLNIDVKYFHNMIHDFKILNIRNPKEYVLFLIDIHKKYHLKMNSNIINLFHTIIITNKYSQNSYNLDMYNYCKTYDIFKDYQLILKNNIQKKKTNIRTNYNEFEHLKKYI